jgi:amino acid adenylation domain-containing protein/non-ribosomal peptide synthase protein (TIGR01720 family)
MTGEDATAGTEPADARRRELLAKLLAGERHTDQNAGIPRTGRRTGPASAAQRRMWLLHRMAPHSAAHHIVIGFRWPDRVDEARLGDCLTAVVERHEALRTAFALEGDRVVQHVLDPAACVVSVHDLPRDADPRDAWRAAASKPFDLAAGPMMRADAFRRYGEPDTVVVTMHHIASDGRSVGILAHELTARYRAATGAAPVTFADLPIQYLDFALWERNQLAEGAFDTDLRYWAEVLAALPDPGTAPAAVESRTGEPGPGRITRADLEPALADALRSMAAHRHATLFMAGVAAFAVLLARYGDRDDIVIGTATSGRDRPEVNDLIGFFVNTVVLRIDLRGRPSFAELLDRVRETCTAAYEHQAVPFDRVVEHLRSQGGEADDLFAAFFTHQASTLLREDGAALPTFGVDLGVASLPFAVTLDTTAADAPHCLFEYATDSFDDATVAQLTAHYVDILRAVSADPYVKVHDLPLGGPQHTDRILTEPGDLVPDRFERRARQTPDAVAVTDGTVDVTFAELDNRADELAWRLRDHGAGPESLVAVCLDRSVELMVAILAILKTGAAYVPLDPDFPTERLRYILDDTSATLGVARRPVLDQLNPAGYWIDVGAPVTGGGPDGPPPRRLRAENVAYVLYTSGSSGRPKGVMLQHGALASFCDAVTRRFSLGPADRFLQFASISFDVAAEEIWPTWLAGGTVVLLPQGPLMSGAEFTELLDQRRVTVAELPTAFWHEWTTTLDRSGFTLPNTVRLVIVGGERIRHDRLLAWRRSPVDLAHVYGLTETAVTSTVLGPGPLWATPEHAANLPVGTPLANTDVHVLDSRLRPMPAGAPGEVYVGGFGVSRGYLRRPDLTADRYVPHPFPRQPGERLYRTGDQARYLSDGTLQFLGRTDEQVKIRGFRVEPAEVAAVLGEHPGVRDAAVVPWTSDRTGRQYLAGYLVPAIPGGPGPDLEDVVAFQRSRLPAHLVVEVLTVMDELPVNHNGKVDRRRLPRPAAPAPSAEPTTAVQRLLRDTWREVLQRDGIGVDDDFFHLGGDSIAAIRVVAAAADAGLRLTARDLFAQRTVAGLAAVATPLRRTATDQGEVTGSAPLTPVQRWFFGRSDLEHRTFVLPVGLQVAAGVDQQTVREAIRQLLLRHDALRIQIADPAGGHQENLPVPAQVPLTVADLSACPAGERAAVRARLVAETVARIDPAQGRQLWALLTVEPPGQPAGLFLCIHHLVMDAVSLRVVLDDLESLCAALHAGPAVTPPGKGTSFLEWARRLDALARSGGTADELAYWQSVVQPPVRRIPRDRPGGVNTEESAAALAGNLDGGLTDALRYELPRHFGIRPVDVLLTALASTLTRWTGGDVLVEMEGHGREELFDDVDVSRTVGWFTAAYPVRLPSPVGDERDHLSTVAKMLRLLPRNGIGYGLLRHGGGKPALTAPEPEVLFNFLGPVLNFTGRWGDGGAETAVIRPAADFDAWRPSTGRRTHLIEVNVAERHGRLHVSWIYSDAVHHESTVRQLADDFLVHIERLVTTVGRSERA